MGKACMRLNRAQEKTLSAERSTQVPRVPKRNSEILADTFSRAQTFYFSFALAFENRSVYFDSVMREAFASKNRATPTLIGRRMDSDPAREQRRQRGGGSRSCQSARAWRSGAEPQVA